MKYNRADRERVLREFNARADEGFAELKGKLSFESFMKSGSKALIRNSVNTIKNLLISVIPTGVAVPQPCLYTTALSGNESEEVSVISLTVSNSTGDPQDYVFKTSVLGSDVADKVFQYLKSVYATLVENEMAKENLSVVNEVFKEAAKEAQLPYSIRFVPPLGARDKKISYISDDSVVFVADGTRLFDLDGIIIFMEEPTELVSEQRIQETFVKLCGTLAKAQTTAELVSMHGGDLISLICDISKRVKPMTLISQVYAKNVLLMRGNKDGIGYYNKDGIFAAVARRNGMLEVILNPISVSTLEPVDFDVLGAIEAEG